MALAVIGAGLGRTGTLSLKAALEMLGFGPCHHMTEISTDRERQAAIWNRVAGGEERDWDAVFAGYNATVDWPGCHYYAELAEAYPDAKVILSLRDPDKWFDSMADTILPYPVPELPVYHPGEPMDPRWFIAEIVMRRTFGMAKDRASVIAAFNRHNDEVRRRIAPDRLLEFDVTQGWDPLCAFLGVPVPDVPFPRTNDKAMFQQLVEKGRREFDR